jgi:uncharacterized protein YegL
LYVLSAEPCGGNEPVEGDGFSRLDLVKHTLNTIISSLSQHDKICLIKFSTSATVIAPLTNLTDFNKKILMEKLVYLKPEDSTNIWDGLKTALDCVATLDKGTSELYNTEIFLLTDGVPNLNPPRPLVETVETYIRKKCADCIPTVHTFGYGYSLQSETLYNVAKVGKGCFGFIPDSSMVGTVFINSLSSSLVSDTHKAHSLENEHILRACDRMCGLLHNVLRHGSSDSQSNEALVRFIEVTEAQLAEVQRDAAADTQAASFLEALLVDCKPSSDPQLGQISKALKAEFFVKWGKHYLYSVLSAFENRVCINFKDRAMQFFKSEKFIEQQERVEELFLQITPPKPSVHREAMRAHSYMATNTGGYNTNTSRSAPVRGGGSYRPPSPPSMASFHNTCGGCFTGDSLVLAAPAPATAPGGSGGASTSTAVAVAVAVAVRADSLCAGSVVWSQQGPTEVECVVKLRYSGVLCAGTY